MLESIVHDLEFVHTTWFRIRATLGCSFISKHVVIVYAVLLYENASKLQRYLFFMHEAIVQASEFVITSLFGICSNLGRSFIFKHIDIVDISSLY